MLRFNNSFSNLHTDFSSYTDALPLDKPHWAIWNNQLAESLGLASDKNEHFLQAFSGGQVLAGSKPLAMVYAGHQFGQYVAQLGDGRGLLLGQLETKIGCQDLHLKGAGPTPYSRQGDGRAVLRSCIREYLCSEALFALGVPTTRALCISSGETQAWREKQEPAAMLVRVAKSHIRFGSFEFFHYRQQYDRVKELVNYCIGQYFPSLLAKPEPERYELFFTAVIQKTASMIAYWQAYGFAHGVMNTDNMSILGDTFDFGPFGFIDNYNPHFICNHSDHTGRYAFAAQPSIGLWNLTALGHALTSLIDQEQVTIALSTYEHELTSNYYALMLRKLGLPILTEEDKNLLGELLSLMQHSSADYTNTFRNLATICKKDKSHKMSEFFQDENAFNGWLEKYTARLEKDERTDEERKIAMNKANPKYILRNYLAQQAITQAEKKDYRELERLAQVLRYPFADQPENEEYAKIPPVWAKKLEISCSS